MVTSRRKCDATSDCVKLIHDLDYIVHTIYQSAAKSAAQAEAKKLSHYQNLSSGYIVMPVAMETLGSIGPMTMQFIKELGSRIIDVTGDKRAKSYLFQRLGIAVQRGNAASIMGTVPSGQKLYELYYL